MPAISLEGVSKKYRVSANRRDRLKRVLSLGKGKAGREFWALNNVNLQVEPGTALGVVGRNGAGKTTLLQTISGVLQPTSGTVRVNGRLVALLALGAGFDDEFTGRENVMLNGLILGIERKEMLKRLDEIEPFADIGDFMDQPLKTYSSGMRARLGFAVAVSVEPDILLVDETLSTGDAVFRAKGIQRMRELRDSGTTVLFVSHSTDQVKNFCTEAILLHRGKLISRGQASQIVDYYEALMSNAAARRDEYAGLDESLDHELAQDDEGGLGTPNFKGNSALDSRSVGLRYGTGGARVQNVELLDDYGRQVDVVTPEKELKVRVHVEYMEDVDNSVIGIILRNKTGIDVFSTNTALEEIPVGSRRAGERLIVDFAFQAPLKHGRYGIAAAVSHPTQEDSYLDWVGVAAAFKMSLPSNGVAFPGLVHLPTQVKIFEPDR